MKKLISILLLLLVTITLNAQKNCEYQFRVSIDKYYDGAPYFDALIGYKLTNKLRLGAGVGFMSTSLPYTMKYDYPSINKKGTLKLNQSQYSLPIFADCKYNFTETKFSPYVDASIGYALPLDETNNCAQGLLMGLNAGLDWNIKHGAIFIQVGYAFHSINKKAVDDVNHKYETNNLYGLSIGLGYILKIK